MKGYIISLVKVAGFLTVLCQCLSTVIGESLDQQFDYYDNFVADPLTQITLSDKSFAKKAVDSKNETHGICNIYSTLRMINGGSSDTGKGSLVGLLMGIHHFNNRNSTVVKDLGDIIDQCKIRFTLDFDDSNGDPKTAVTELSKAIGEDKVCVILGASRSAVSIPMAVISGVNDIPQLSHLSTSTELDKHANYPFFSRLVPSDAGVADAMVKYFAESIKISHICIVYVNDSYGISYAKAIQNAGYKYSLQTQAFALPYDPDENNVLQLIKSLKRTNIHYFVAVTFHFDILMASAITEGLIGPDYFWMLTDATKKSSFEKTFEKGSSEAKAMKGIGRILASSGVPGMKGYDKYLSVHHGIGEEEVAYFNSKLPAQGDIQGDEYYGKFTTDNFDPKSKDYQAPNYTGLYMYDSVMALGIAACKSVGTDGIFFSSKNQYDYFSTNSFEGASGTIATDPVTFSRAMHSAVFVIYNSIEASTSEGKSKFTMERSNIFYNGTWTQKSPFIYADGSTFPPPNFPLAVVDKNFIKTAVFVTGIVMFIIVLVLSIGFATYTIYNRNHKVMKASQPHFLCLLCVGTMVLGSAIIPLIFDGKRFNQEFLDRNCMSIPWLVSIGYGNIFSTFFIKTWRLNRIFHNASLRRIAVSKRDVIGPFLVVFVLNMIVLTIWTIRSPWSYQTQIISIDEFDRVVESSRSCAKTNNEWPIYAGLLCLINFSVLVFASIQAFRARKIELDFSESQFLAIAMICTMQVLFIGIPLIYIVDGTNNSASCFMRITIIFVSCTANLLLIFVPKIKYCYENRCVIEMVRRSTRSLNSRPSGRSSISRAPSTSEFQEAPVYSTSIVPSPAKQNEHANQITELEKMNTKLEKLNERKDTELADLQMTNKKLSKDISDLENKIQSSETKD